MLLRIFSLAGSLAVLWAASLPAFASEPFLHKLPPTARNLVAHMVLSNPDAAATKHEVPLDHRRVLSTATETLERQRLPQHIVQEALRHVLLGVRAHRLDEGCELALVSYAAPIGDYLSHDTLNLIVGDYLNPTEIQLLASSRLDDLLAGHHAMLRFDNLPATERVGPGSALLEIGFDQVDFRLFRAASGQQHPPLNPTTPTEHYWALGVPIEDLGPEHPASGKGYRQLVDDNRPLSELNWVLRHHQRAGFGTQLEVIMPSAPQQGVRVNRADFEGMLGIRLQPDVFLETFGEGVAFHSMIARLSAE